MTTTRILVATDFSEPSDEALRQSAAYVADLGAKLHVCHVIPVLYGADPLFPQSQTYAQIASMDLESKARAAVEQRLRAVLGPNDAEIHIEQGSEYAAVVRCAEHVQATMIIVGTHGRKSLARLVLGSVAEQVVRYAHCPVLVARPEKKKGVVLATTDFSDPSLPALRAAGAEAARRKANLVLMHAIDFPSAALTTLAPFGSVPVLPSAESQDDAKKLVTEALEDALKRLGLLGEVRVVVGPPAASIVESAEALGAELLVVATRGRTGLSRVALGSVAERVLRAATCPVLAVRLKD